MPVDTMSPSTGLTPRRRELLQAALQVVADEGLRGLTPVSYTHLTLPTN